MGISGLVRTSASALIIGSAAAAAAGGGAHAQSRYQEPVRIPVYNVPDSDFIDYTFGQILDKAGYRVEYLKIDYMAHFTALEFGDVDISPAVWGTTKDLVDKAIGTGDVGNAGNTDVHTRESWWYPNYVAELCPGLPDYKALKDPACVKALTTPESNGKINYLGAPPDFATYDVERIAALGLEVNITPPGTVGVMVATMQGAMQKKEPIVAWGITPHWLYGSGEGQFVEFPLFEDACATDPAWGENPNAIWDCALSVGEVLKLYNVDFAERAPDVIKILEAFTLSTDDVALAISRQDLEGATPEQAAKEWIEANEATWSQWLL